MKDGDIVEVLLHGDDTGWYRGKVIKARKMWAQLENYQHGVGFIADESNIKEWRHDHAAGERQESK